jgi:acyl carrier protein
MMEQKILELMKSVFQTEDIDETCSQQNCEKWDSMNHLNLVVEFEMEFGVSFEPEEIAVMRTYEDVVRIVKSKLS